MNPELWEYEVKDVKRNYPDAAWAEVRDGVLQTRAWRLTMDPTPNEGELAIILADLEEGRMVRIGLRGKISHSTKCEISAKNHPILMPHLKLPQQAYIVDLIYRPPRKTAIWPIQPMAQIINPEISVRTYPNHPHMYLGKGSSWACPLSPQDKSWKLCKGATVKYLDQVSLWLLKTMVWISTGAGVAGLGKWIGPDTSHEPMSLFKSIPPNNPCWCGSGICYRDCHRQSDMKNGLIRRITEIR